MRLLCPAALEIIKSYEGFSATAYRCPAGLWTIGWGHTRGVGPSDSLDPEAAERLLLEDLEGAMETVERLVRVPLSAEQFGALVSFVFNVGGGAFARSTLLRRLNAGDLAAVPEQFARWVKARDPESGKRRSLPGLVRRRAAEARLWLEGSEEPSEPMAQAALV